ncbi:MAG: 2-deoxyribose-5-phosphate aldolase, partial [Spirochaetales bacterium]|nr:2-deoxyribose-5-phosphate aldolase [Spirochaetales bacterium]
MNKNDICRYIDNTLLKQYSSADDFLKFADESIPYNFASLCVNPWAVPLIKKRIDGTNNKIATVIGFPNGISSPNVKLYETQKALDDGANEIDFVINIGLLKSGDTA